MPRRRRTEQRTFAHGWVSDVNRSRAIDAFRLPKNIWEDPTELGALTSTPGRTNTATDADDISALLRFESSAGTVRRYIQVDAAVAVLNAAGTIGADLKTGLTASKKLAACAMSQASSGDEYAFFFNGTDTPFKIKLSDNAVSNTGLTRPDVSQGPLTVELKQSTGTATSAHAGGTQLTDTAATFLTDKVKAGDRIVNTTDGSTATVTTVDSETQITHSTLVDGTDNDWDSSDAYKVKRPAITGIVKYWVSRVSSTTEGALSDSSGTVDCEEGNAVTITFPNDAEWNSRNFNIYRTYPGQYIPFYVGRVDIGASGGSFTDEVPEAELGDPPFAHGDAPPSGIFDCVTYWNRVYGIDKSKLYWSDPGNPESFFTQFGGNHLPVGHNDGDVCTALVAEERALVIFKKDHIYRLYGSQPSDFSPGNMEEIVPSGQGSRSIGTPSTTSWCATPRGIFFYFNLQFYMLPPGGKPVRISELVEDDMQTLLGDSDFDESGLWDINCVYTPKYGRVWCSVHPSTSDNAFTVFYDVQRGRFVGAAEWGYRCFLVEDYGNSEVLFLGGSRGAPSGSHDTKKIYKADYTTTIARDQLVIHFPFGGDTQSVKRFGSVDLWCKNVGASRAADVFIDVDGVRVTTSTAQTISDTTSRGRRATKVYAGGSLGHDAELTFTADAGTNTTNPVTLYAASCTYQDLGLDLAKVI